MHKNEIYSREHYDELLGLVYPIWVHNQANQVCSFSGVGLSSRSFQLWNLCHALWYHGLGVLEYEYSKPNPQIQILIWFNSLFCISWVVQIYQYLPQTQPIQFTIPSTNIYTIDSKNHPLQHGTLAIVGRSPFCRHTRISLFLASHVCPLSDHRIIGFISSLIVTGIGWMDKSLRKALLLLPKNGFPRISLNFKLCIHHSYP